MTSLTSVASATSPLPVSARPPGPFMSAVGAAPAVVPAEFPAMAATLAELVEPVLNVVLSDAVAALAAHGFAREPGHLPLVSRADEDRLHVVASCTVSDAAGEQRLSIVVTYVLQQAWPWRKPEVTGKVYLVVGVVGQVPLDRYDRADALGAALLTHTLQKGIALEPAHFAEGVALLEKDCASGARQLTHYAKVVARVLARKLEP